MSHLLNVILQRYSYPKGLTTEWFEMKLQLTIITLALISIAIPTANASHPVPFDDWINHDCETLTDGTFRCDWTPGTTNGLTDEDKPLADEPDTPPTPMPGEDQGTPPVITSKTEPLTAFEFKIKQLEEKKEEGTLKPSEKQVLRALLSFQKDCELGTEEGAPIQNYELFKVSSWDPYVNTDLSTNYILNQIEREQEKCTAQKTLKNKVLGEQYLHIPGKDDVKILYQTNATLPEDVQAKYDEAKMFDYFSQKTKNDAEDFKCTKEGRARGLGFDCKTETDEAMFKTTLSQEAEERLSKYRAYQQTGVTDIPVKEPDAQPNKDSIARQYLASLGYSTEQIDAALAAMEDESEE